MAEHAASNGTANRERAQRKDRNPAQSDPLSPVGNPSFGGRRRYGAGGLFLFLPDPDYGT